MYIILPCGPGYPILGQPNDCLSLPRMYIVLPCGPGYPIKGNRTTVFRSQECIFSYLVVQDINFGATDGLSIVVKRCILSYLVVLGIHFWANRTAVCRSQEVYTPVQCQTKASNL